jgi:hypothetical protein
MGWKNRDSSGRRSLYHDVQGLTWVAVITPTQVPSVNINEILSVIFHVVSLVAFNQ